jgi:hypothetical protein
MRTSLGLVVLLALPVCFAGLLTATAAADVGPPAHMQISEREPGLYSVQWRVPKVLPPRAIPVPALPETCALIGDPEIADQPAAWLISGVWRCETTLAGQEVGMRYPFPDLALTTVVRVDLLSGDRFAHVLTLEELSWRLPEGTAAPDLVLEAQRAVGAGARHALGSWLHFAFLLVLGLLFEPGTGSTAGGVAGLRRPLWLVTVFTLAQVAGVLIAGVAQALASDPYAPIGTIPTEIGFAVGVILLARQAIESEGERRRLESLTGAAGLVHGLGTGALLAADLGEEASGVIAQLLVVLGMDAVHLVGALVATYLVTLLAGRSRPVWARSAVAYALGASAMALAISLSIHGGDSEAGAIDDSLQAPPGSAAGSAAGMPGSRRLAPAVGDAPIQSFLSIEPFEVRQEVMFRLARLTQALDLDPESILEIADQPAVSDRLAELVVENTVVQVDGTTAAGTLRRVDFMTVDPNGALPRPNPVLEPVSEAVVGVIIAYPASGMPEDVSLRWEAFPSPVETVPATVIDPETVTSGLLSPGGPSLTWENALIEDPIPAVDAVAVEPSMLPVPLLSLPLLVTVVGLVFVGARDRRKSGSQGAAGWIAAARVALALAFLVGPLLQTSVALPGSAGRTPSERQARRILAGLLPNVYRSLEFREEGMIYDRLAVSVTGETLTEVYLDQREALEMEERGGAQARVESVEVLEAGEIESTEAGFSVRAAWTVGGMVTHFGHRHFRQNRYDARIGITPESGTWKIQTVDVLEQERVR